MLEKKCYYSFHARELAIASGLRRLFFKTRFLSLVFKVTGGFAIATNIHERTAHHSSTIGIIIILTSSAQFSIGSQGLYRDTDHLDSPCRLS
jgi:hypothetical protein